MDTTSKEATNPTPKEDWAQSCDVVNEVIEEKIKRDYTESGKSYGIVMQAILLAYKAAIELDKAIELGEYIADWLETQQRNEQLKETTP